MTREKSMAAAFSGLFLLTECNRENPCKKYATKENFLSHSKNEFYIEFQDDSLACTNPHFDTEHLIVKAVASVEFTEVTDKNEIEFLDNMKYIADIATSKSCIAFRLCPDFTHTSFFSRTVELINTPYQYSSYQKIKKEDGERLFETIKQAYIVGQPNHNEFNQCNLM